MRYQYLEFRIKVNLFICGYIVLQTGFHWDCDNWHSNENNKKKYIYKIARMSQGSIKKKRSWTMGREFLHSKTLGKSQRNKRQVLTKPT